MGRPIPQDPVPAPSTTVSDPSPLLLGTAPLPPALSPQSRTAHNLSPPPPTTRIFLPSRSPDQSSSPSEPATTSTSPVDHPSLNDVNTRSRSRFSVPAVTPAGTDVARLVSFSNRPNNRSFVQARREDEVREGRVANARDAAAVVDGSASPRGSRWINSPRALNAWPRPRTEEDSALAPTTQQQQQSPPSSARHPYSWGGASSRVFRAPLDGPSGSTTPTSSNASPAPARGSPGTLPLSNYFNTLPSTLAVSPTPRRARSLTPNGDRPSTTPTTLNNTSPPMTQTSLDDIIVPFRTASQEAANSLREAMARNAEDVEASLTALVRGVENESGRIEHRLEDHRGAPGEWPDSGRLSRSVDRQQRSAETVAILRGAQQSLRTAVAYAERLEAVTQTLNAVSNDAATTRVTSETRLARAQNALNAVSDRRTDRSTNTARGELRAFPSSAAASLQRSIAQLRAASARIEEVLSDSTVPRSFFRLPQPSSTTATQTMAETTSGDQREVSPEEARLLFQRQVRRNEARSRLDVVRASFLPVPPTSSTSPTSSSSGTTVFPSTSSPQPFPLLSSPSAPSWNNHTPPSSSSWLSNRLEASLQRARTNAQQESTTANVSPPPAAPTTRQTPPSTLLLSRRPFANGSGSGRRAWPVKLDMNGEEIHDEDEDDGEGGYGVRNDWSEDGGSESEGGLRFRGTGGNGAGRRRVREEMCGR